MSMGPENDWWGGTASPAEWSQAALCVERVFELPSRRMDVCFSATRVFSVEISRDLIKMSNVREWIELVALV